MRKIDYNNAVRVAADEEYTNKHKTPLRDAQDAEIRALELEMQDPAHPLHLESRNKILTYPDDAPAPMGGSGKIRRSGLRRYSVR